MPVLTPRRRGELKEAVEELHHCYETTGTLDMFLTKARDRGSKADASILCLIWYAFEYATENKLP